MSSRKSGNMRKGTRKTKKRSAPKRNKALVHTYGANEPQSYPFITDSRATRKSIRYFAGRVPADATGSFQHRVSLRNPARALDGAGTYTDVATLSNIWDVYKPVKLRIELVPIFAVNSFGVGSLVLAPDYEDLDQSQVVNTVADANQYNERKIIDVRFKTVTEFRIPTLSAGSIPGLTSTAPAVIQAGGFLDFQAPPTDGVVYLVGTGFPQNLAVFDIYLEMDILLKFAR